MRGSLLTFVRRRITGTMGIGDLGVLDSLCGVHGFIGLGGSYCAGRPVHDRIGGRSVDRGYPRSR